MRKHPNDKYQQLILTIIIKIFVEDQPTCIIYYKQKLEIQMYCQLHQEREVQLKCLSCGVFLCNECQRQHLKKQRNINHDIVTIFQLCQDAKQRLNAQINRLTNKIYELNNLGDYEMGQAIIEACLKQINNYIYKYFEKIKEDYRKICDTYWNAENINSIKQLEYKKNLLKGWKEILKSNPSKIVAFQVQEIYETNKLDSDEELLESSTSFLSNNCSPKICFNELALQRLNQLIGKVIYISQKNPIQPNKIRKGMKKNSSSRSRKSIGLQIINEKFCKFIEGTNYLYEYEICESQKSESEALDTALRKIEFREFVCPLRAVGITVNQEVYLIGGQSLKDKKRSREVWLYQRQYNSMRIITLMKKGRVSHCVCSDKTDSLIYVFGGKQSQSLQKIDIKNKCCQEIGNYPGEIVGASMIKMKNSLYIFGGMIGPVTLNPNIIIFNLQKRMFNKDLAPLNYEQFKIPITPLLQINPLNSNQTQILIIGGYFEYDKSSYINNHILNYNVDYNYISKFGKAEILYPILSNGNADCLCYNEKSKKISGIVDMKRSNKSHGPNYGIIFEYMVKESEGSIQFFGI